MNYLNERKLAFYLSVVAIITIILMGLIGVGLSFVAGHDSKKFIFFAIIAGVFISPYFSFKMVLNKKEKIWGISLKTNETYEKFVGSSYLKFYLGFIWRVMVLNVLATSIVNKLDNESALLGFIASFAVTYIALYWLFKYPYGNTVLLFNVKHNEATPEKIESMSELIPAPPLEISSSERTAPSESYSSVFKNIAQGSLGTVFFLSYLGVGLVQLAAVYDFFHDVWGWWVIPSGIMSTIVAYIPLLGNIAGFYSAYTIWDWPFWGAFLLFFWPIILIIVVTLVGLIQTLFEKINR